MGARVMPGSMFRGGNSPRCKGAPTYQPLTTLCTIYEIHSNTNTQIAKHSTNTEQKYSPWCNPCLNSVHDLKQIQPDWITLELNVNRFKAVQSVLCRETESVFLEILQ